MSRKKLGGQGYPAFRQAQARADTFSSRNGFFCVISVETGLISPEDFLRFGMCGLTFLSRLQN